MIGKYCRKGVRKIVRDRETGSRKFAVRLCLFLTTLEATTNMTA